jgi:hypothetical protein
MSDDERDIDDVVDELAAQRWKRGERERVGPRARMPRWDSTTAKPSTRPVISSSDGRSLALVSTRSAQIAGSGAVRMSAVVRRYVRP